MFLVIFWFAYQLVQVMRASEDIVGILTSTADINVSHYDIVDSMP